MKGKMDGAKTGAKTTVAHPDEDKYDVKYVKLNVEMTNVATTLRGDVTTLAKVVAPTMNAYVFELRAPLVIDSVLINGINTAFTTAGEVRTATFAAPMTAGTIFIAKVFYNGTPVTGTTFTSQGISTVRSPSWNRWATFTLSQPYSAKNWWPCKQSLRDKIDSADIWITVDDSLKAGSNGILQAITPMGGSRNRFEWKERYPIDYYLISLAASRYVDYSYYMHFSGSADSMLVQNYIYDNPGTLTAFKSIIDSTAQQIDYFSTLFGRYPFWKEKYGHCMAPLSGGMEHQTMTTLGFFESWLVAHELGHQWFGDNVTCGSWADITMNEGFASYTEYLYADHFRGHAAAIADIRDRQDNVMSEPDGVLFVDDTTSDTRIFDSRLSYDKGACVIHTLRQVINNDTYFFDLLRGWQTAMKDSTGTIDEFKNLAATMMGPVVNGISLDTFFKQWFYKEGYPAFTAQWNQSGSDVFVHLSQATTVPSSVSLFKIPLEIRLRSPLGDTVIRVLNDQSSQEYHFNWSKVMSSVTLDPNHWLIDSVTSITKDVTLGLPGTMPSAITISPNPTTDNWIATAIPANSTLTLTDVTGKVLWQAVSGPTGIISVPAQKLAPGMYLLRVSNIGYGEKVFKLSRG
jgi:aminopeptidase N